MISLVEALNYRSLRYISQPLNSFHVLIGPNASGKSTFLDVVAFLSRLVTDGVEAAITERTENFVDLLWQRSGTHFELAIEAVLPWVIQQQLSNEKYTTIRYEIVVGIVPDSESQEVGILEERLSLKPAIRVDNEPRQSFPNIIEEPETIISRNLRSRQLVLSKNRGGNDNFIAEIKNSKKVWNPSFRLGYRKTALGNLPEDKTKFPAAIWLKELLTEGVQKIVLNSALIRRPSPPNQRGGFLPDGSNLPWVVHLLTGIHKTGYQDWISHLQTSLPDIKNVLSVIRHEDNHRYLMLEYQNGLRVPAWMVSDGTLRMIALTLLAYMLNFNNGVYLIEEPENGIHPTAVETVFQSLSSVYDAQVLLASHSPVVLNCASAANVLCFARNEVGATDIVSGVNHPRLQEWKDGNNIGLLFASGVLG